MEVFYELWILGWGLIKPPKPWFSVYGQNLAPVLSISQGYCRTNPNQALKWANTCFSCTANLPRRMYSKHNPVIALRNDSQFQRHK